MTNILHAAVATNITSVAVCALGSGIFGWDAKLAREVLVRATFAWERARLTRPCTVITVVFFDMSHTGTAFFGTAVSTALREARAAARAPLLPIPSIELSTADSLCVRDQVKLTEPARRTVQYLLHALLACMRTQCTTCLYAYAINGASAYAINGAHSTGDTLSAARDQCASRRDLVRTFQNRRHAGVYAYIGTKHVARL